MPPPRASIDSLDLGCFRESFLVALEPEIQSLARGFGLYLGGLVDEDRLRRGDLEGLGLEEVEGALADLEYSERVLTAMFRATLEAPSGLAEVQLARAAADAAEKLRILVLELDQAVVAYRRRESAVTDAYSDQRLREPRGPRPKAPRHGSEPLRSVRRFPEDPA